MEVEATAVTGEEYLIDGYLDCRKVLDEIKLLGVIVANRNIGKTYGFLNLSVGDALATFHEKTPLKTLEDFEKMNVRNVAEWQFFFLRRTQSQAKEAGRNLILEDFYEDFLASICPEIIEQNEIYIDYEGSSEGVREVYIFFENKENRKQKKKILIGFISAISAAEKIRKTGFPFVKLIIVDEFQAKKWWDYLPNEPMELLDIFDSITRERANKGDCKMVMLGNAGTILNPHFAFYDYDEFEQVRTIKKGGAAIFYHFDMVAKSRTEGAFYDLISDTEYGDYSLKNQYGDLKDFNVVKLSEAPGPRKCLYNVKLNNISMGVWKDGDNRMIISRLGDPEKLTFVDTMPMGNERLHLEAYLSLSDMLRGKMLYFDAPDLRIHAEKQLRKYIFKNDSGWQSAK